MEPRDLPSFNAVKITRQTSPKQAPIDKRRIKTIFNHFRDKPARAASDNVNSRIVLLTSISTFLLLALVVAASAQTRTVGVSVGNKLARMRVPKMVKNGYNSILHVSAAFEENKYL